MPPVMNRPRMSEGSHAWDAESLRDPHRQSDKSSRVRAMFNAIAPTYERVNTLATFGRDAAWRRRTVAAANVRPGDVVLDVACGTGDMIRAFARGSPPPARLIGVDFAEEMLARGRYDGVSVPVELHAADALALPLADASVDVVSCAFGVRNFSDLDAGLREMLRVLRPGGRLVILEFALPENPLLRGLYVAYCNVILPRLGAWVAREKVGAYRYLPKSVSTFDRKAALLARITQTGFVNATAAGMNFGGVVLYRAIRP